MSSVTEIKTFVRDINLTLLSTSKKIDIDISKRYCDKIRLLCSTDGQQGHNHTKEKSLECRV